MARASTLRKDGHDTDTIPTPPGRDAYHAETVVRAAPPELLAALLTARAEVQRKRSGALTWLVMR